ncbi:hypothetical protein SD80_008880 [Scytonema tolypothrichoides VB-61278]|nr:hypothetical protein SD80_008880 [Scytonema tolypothrichoides VB-61278]
MTLINLDMQIICKLSTMKCAIFLHCEHFPEHWDESIKLEQATHNNIDSLMRFFLTFVFIGFILGCFLQYQRYKKLRAKLKAEILKEFETLQKIQKMTPEIDETVPSLRKQQIETLEKIWKMKP